MCSKPKIEKPDAVQPPPPMITVPKAPVLNETTRAANTDAGKAARAKSGRSSLTIPLAAGATGINIPR